MDRDAMRTESSRIYAAVGVDARIAGACRRKEMQSGSGGGRGAGGAQGSALNIRGGSEVASSGARRTRAGLVFVKKGETFEPRLVQLGASNFDYTEIASGLKEGEQVALLAAAALQAQRQLQNDRMKASTGVPGLQQAPTGGAGGAGGARGGAGGGRPGGG